MGEIHTLLEQIDEKPLPSNDGRQVGVGTLLTAIVTPLYSETLWPELSLMFRDVQSGNGDFALKLADFYYDRSSNGEYETNSLEAFTAINCIDYPQEDVDLESMRKQAEKLEEKAPTLGKFQGYGDVGCAGWPVKSQSLKGPVLAKGADPIVVIGTTGDPATPYHWAESLAKQLESGVLVTLEGEGHTAYGSGNACVNTAVDNYFVLGEVPQNGLVCQ